LTPQEKSDLGKIIQVVSGCAKVERVVLFGSRAKKNHRESSDWDIALKGDEISLPDILSLQVQIDELWLPCAVDLVVYNSIQNSALKEHIDKVGIVVWNRNS
jgi:predicted nucleotidyltransferase